jgi:hypothetical protein
MFASLSVHVLLCFFDSSTKENVSSSSTARLSTVSSKPLQERAANTVRFKDDVSFLFWVGLRLCLDICKTDCDMIWFLCLKYSQVVTTSAIVVDDAAKKRTHAQLERLRASNQAAAELMDDDLVNMLLQHNKKMKPAPGAYVPPMHSVKEIREVCKRKESR